MLPRLRHYSKLIVTTIFDYLVSTSTFHAHVALGTGRGLARHTQRSFHNLKLRMLNQFEAFFRKARSAGLLRSDFVPLIQLSMILQICLSYLTFVPLYQMIRPPGEDLFSAAALARAREYIVDFVVHGMMIDLRRNNSHKNYSPEKEICKQLIRREIMHLSYRWQATLVIALGSAHGDSR